MYDSVQIVDHMKVHVSYYYSFVEDLCRFFVASMFLFKVGYH